MSIYDDGTLEDGLNSSSIDGEGTPSQRTTLIENGILKNFLYDIYTSRKGGVESTGNGMRGSYADMMVFHHEPVCNKLYLLKLLWFYTFVMGQIDS